MKKIILVLLLFTILFPINCLSKKLQPVDSSGWVQKNGYWENEYKTGMVSKMKFTPDGKTLLTIGSDNIFRKWDLESGKVLDEFLIPYSNIACLDFNDEGNIFAVSIFKYKESWEQQLIDTVYIFDSDTIISKIIPTTGYKINSKY